jgi:chaperone BCS1
MDVWVNFTHATKYQAEGIFKCFFPSKPPTSSTTPLSVSSESTDASQKNLPVPKRKAPAHVVPLLEEAEISELAKRFAAAIPEDELSVASLQGYLLKNKTRPRECVEEVGEWIIQERETREKLKKEKAEREAKEKKEAAEKERKEKEEKEEKEAKEKEEKEKLERKELRTKAKKTLRAETTLRTETPAASSLEDSQSIEAHGSSSESASSSGTDSNAGIEADTEESVTSEEEASETEPSPISESGPKDAGKEKWVAVKGQPAPAASA